ncbi:Nmad3 family putative nucleotide modification protein [Halogeometricum limi]|uniref:Nucleotide modification associated domain-containing protein n=1 Tax=Halogeometricum limi TaxID=555875 RepID=A0A1I6H6L7_9EURY|nr:hypothetical protein [Halogeometricum limi]SFR50020.1 hypothetical protein SAMN04488124_1835 [Halogeometricum limi]
MTRAIAVNVAANSTLPGVRGPVYADGTFAYVPIPEREPTRRDASVPTYADLDPPVEIPEAVRDAPVHLDPEFSSYPYCERDTYGDDHGVKAGPISTLDPGDWLFFYATLDYHGDAASAADYLAPDWGAYLVGGLEVDVVVTGEDYESLSADERARFANNAHVKRETFDARVLVAGTDRSGLFDRVVPLSSPEAGADANRLVTDLSNDSGKGPWWRRVLRFDADATAELLAVLDSRAFGPYLD